MKLCELNLSDIKSVQTITVEMTDEIQGAHWPAAGCRDHKDNKPNCYLCALTTMNSYLMNRVAYLEVKINQLGAML